MKKKTKKINTTKTSLVLTSKQPATLKETEPDEDIAVRPKCKFTVCESPETGDIVFTYDKGCPKGYIEKIAGKIAVSGLRFSEEPSEKD